MFRRRRSQADFDAEIAAHLQLEIDRLREAGMSEQAAKAAAHRAFGNVTAVRERFYETRRLLFWDRLVQDVKFALRLLRRTPVLTAAVIATLALGIGVASAIFSLVNAVVLRPLPYDRPGRLVQVFESGPREGGEADWVAFPNFRDWRRDGGVFEDMAAYRYAMLTLTGAEAAESMVGLEVTDRLFAVLSVRPILGRTFLPGEDAPGRGAVAVISHALWQRRFAADPNVIGTGITIDGQSHVIVGVMPAWFRFPLNVIGETAFPIELWIPVRPSPDLEERGSHNFWAVARLKPDATVEQARAVMTSIASNLARQYPATNKDLSVTVQPLGEYVSGRVRPALLVLLGAVGLVLLLTCANIAGLLLTRAETRRRELAMRQALGASRARLVRQTLTESLLLALAGAGVGAGVAHVGARLLVRLAPASIPRLEETAVDSDVLLFTGIVTVCVGILFGLAPALLGWRANVHDTLKATATRVSDGSAARRVRQMLVAGQLAMAVILLIGAGLLVRSFARVAGLELGFHAPRVLTAFVNLSSARYGSAERQSAFFEEAVRQIEAIPGVVAAAVSNTVPLTGVNDQGGLQIEGIATPPGEDGPVGNRPRVSAGYFEAMGIRRLEGRLFDERDRRDSAPVAVVSELAARRYWPEGALGKRLATEWTDDGPVWREVVGVVRSTRHFGLEAPQKAEFYLPHVQAASPFMQLVIRTAHDPAAIIPAVRREIAAMDRDQAVFGFQTMEQLLTNAGARRRFQMALVTAFAALALMLAAIGVYAVMSHVVAQRKREMGVRLALGARPSDVIALVLRSGLRVTVVGTAIGLAGAAALSQVLTHLLYGVSPLDPATYLGVTAVLVGVAALAAYLPGRSAGRVDPLLVLRDD
jgi:putative ABC transport system permease protein